MILRCACRQMPERQARASCIDNSWRCEKKSRRLAIEITEMYLRGREKCCVKYHTFLFEKTLVQ